MANSEFENFIGKTVFDILISDDHTYMYWLVDNQWYEIYAEGDCCSSSWFEAFEDPDVIIGTKLLAFEDSQTPQASHVPDPEDDQEDNYIQYNFLKFTTIKGYCTIEFRNSSNGYYSGYCSFKEVTIPSTKMKLSKATAF